MSSWTKVQNMFSHHIKPRMWVCIWAAMHHTGHRCWRLSWSELHFTKLEGGERPTWVARVRPGSFLVCTLVITLQLLTSRGLQTTEVLATGFRRQERCNLSWGVFQSRHGCTQVHTGLLAKLLVRELILTRSVNKADQVSISWAKRRDTRSASELNKFHTGTSLDSHTEVPACKKSKSSARVLQERGSTRWSAIRLSRSDWLSLASTWVFKRGCSRLV